MRVLLFLYGHYRSFDRTIHTWLSSLEGCEFDCRFVTFDRIDHSTKCWWHNNIGDHKTLTNDQIDLLKKYDPDTKILTQEFSKEELDDIHATLPLKVYMYKYNTIKDILSSIDDTKYDMIILSRFDVVIRNITFKDVSIHLDEIKIGARKLSTCVRGLIASDMLCAFHPKNKNFFYNMPSDIINRKFIRPEEIYTDFYYEHFKTVDHIWEFSRDFDMLR